MSYEIPQQLEYKEKIIFGLTFRQLLYGVIFSPLALAILLKSPFPLEINITLALIPLSIAVIFMFTNIPQNILNICKWHRKRTIKHLIKIEIEEDVLEIQ